MRVPHYPPYCSKRNPRAPHHRAQRGTPRLVVQGAVQLVAATVTRLLAFTAADLVLDDLKAWRTLRTPLESQRHQRTLRRRFRHNPTSYLVTLEVGLLKLLCPP